LVENYGDKTGYVIYQTAKAAKKEEEKEAKRPSFQ
jgi:hypothetical protein